MEFSQEKEYKDLRKISFFLLGAKFSGEKSESNTMGENFEIGLKWMKKQKLDWATSNLESAANINDQINMLNLIKHSSEAFYSLKRANINVEQQSYNSFQ